MKARRILMRAPMVRAILDGRKTQTRRVVKPQPWGVMPQTPRKGEAPWPYVFDYYEESTTHGEPRAMLCPYGRPGDLLWVRETWRVTNWIPDDGELRIRYEADGATEWRQVPEESDPDGDVFNRYWLESTDDFEEAGFQFVPECLQCENGEWVRDGETLSDQIVTRKRPSIFMPRWASRLTLRIADVRVERVQEIRKADAYTEGYLPDSFYRELERRERAARLRRLTGVGPESAAQDWFAKVWDSISAKRGYSWESNPWVWAIEFEVIRKNVGAVVEGA